MSEQLRARDAKARRRAQEQFVRPLVLEAGAGTGKTATLVARVVAWCLGPGWKRASAELKDGERDAVARREQLRRELVAKGHVFRTASDSASSSILQSKM